jgi:F420H(2)-dependent quinone reductase
MRTGLKRRLPPSRLGFWSVKHLFSPLDRRLYRWTGGCLTATGRPPGPLLLLTTTGRRTGQERTAPVFSLRDGARLVVCHAKPAPDRGPAWPANLRAHPVARVQIGAEAATYRAREATAEEVARYWPPLLAIWPAEETYYARPGERTIFVLERLAG